MDTPSAGCRWEYTEDVSGCHLHSSRGTLGYAPCDRATTTRHFPGPPCRRVAPNTPPLPGRPGTPPDGGGRFAGQSVRMRPRGLGAGWRESRIDSPTPAPQTPRPERTPYSAGESGRPPGHPQCSGSLPQTPLAHAPAPKRATSDSGNDHFGPDVHLVPQRIRDSLQGVTWSVSCVVDSP